MMNSNINMDIIKSNYQRMTNEELINVATKDVKGLTPEAQKIVLDELAKRNLDSSIGEGVVAQNKTITEGEIDNFCGLIRDLYCPSCGSNETPLNATMTSEVVSMIIVTNYKKKLKIGCPDCLDKANSDALSKSVVFGWWGIPWGIIHTISAISNNIKSKKTNRLAEPNNYLKSFVLSKVGWLESYRDDQEKLREIISG